MSRAAQGRAHARLRGVLALLVAVVALLCVFGHAEGAGQGAPLTATQSGPADTVAEPSDGGAAPCGKKAVADPGAQRAAELTPPSAPCPAAVSSPVDSAPSVARHAGVLSGSPAPPPLPLHSVLRI